MFHKTQVVDRVEVIESGCVQVRTKTTIFENDQPVSHVFHRHVLIPGNDYSNEDDRVKAICKAVHTADVVAAYTASQVDVVQLQQSAVR